MKVYRQDFTAIATPVTGDGPARLTVVDITKGFDANRFRRLRERSRSSVDPPLLVHVECVVHLPLTSEQVAANPMNSSDVRN
jgi:hypothetical protein